MLGLTGMKGWRFKGALALFIPASILIMWDGQPDTEGFWAQMWFNESLTAWWADIAKDWIKIRVWFILFTALALGVMNLGRTGWRARSVMWAMGSSSVFFIVYSGDDWMKAHRWFNVVVVFMYPILAAGLIAAASHLGKGKQWALGWILAFGLIGLALWDGEIERPAAWYAAMHDHWQVVQISCIVVALLAVFGTRNKWPVFRWRLSAYAMLLWAPMRHLG